VLKTSWSARARALALLAVVLARADVVGASDSTPGAGANPDSGNSPTPAPEAQFDIHEYRVLGNTVLPNRDIESVLYPLLGEHKTIADVQSARAALEKAYHDRGFGTIFVDIPEQDVNDKIVRLKVTEGRLEQVHIAGARYFSERKILAALPAATSGSVPNLPELQQQLTAVNLQTSDRSVVPILKAGSQPGTVDLSLKVDDHMPLHGSIEIDNQNTPDTRPLRSTVSLSYTNLFAQFDSLSAQYQLAPQEVSQVNVFAVNYAWGALPGTPHPSVYFIESNSDVPTVGTIGVLGKGQIVGSRLAFPLVGTEAVSQSLTLGFDYKHFRQTIGLESMPAVVTPISYTNLSVAYAGSWSWSWLQEAFGSAANFGPRGAPNDPVAFENKRFEGRPNYFYLKIDNSLIAHLPKGVQLILRADGQYAVEPLITNEDYSISGADGVRGYLEAEVLSDKGLKGSAQLQSPVLHWHTWPLGDAFLFYDAGRADVIDPLPGEPASTILRSWGGGFHLLPGKPINGVLTLADPLVNGPFTHRDEPRVLFDVQGAF
jgi:hemolysin activation/secretion protein